MKHSDRYFLSAPAENLGRKTARGGVVMLGGQGLLFALQLGSTIVLARLLSPEDFGLVGMVTVVVTFIGFFKDFGLSQATVQRQDLSHEQVSNLFWINFGLGILAAGILCAISPLVAAFYERPELVEITMVLAIGLLFQGFSAQFSALLTRDMAFKKLALTQVSGRAVGVGVAIWMAMNGFGYWSLVALPVAPAIFSAALFFLLTRWYPGPPRRRVGTKPLLTYGGNLFGFNLLNFFTRNADNILIGWYWGATALGFYATAYKLLLLPMQQLTAPLSKVFLPALCRVQDDPERFRRVYRKSLGAVAFLTLPIVAFSATCPTLIVTTLLGEQWAEAGTIYLALLPVAFWTATNVATGWVFKAKGTTDRMLKWSVLAAPLNVTAMAFGLIWGSIGVAISLSIVTTALRFPAVRFAFKGSSLQILDFCKPLQHPFQNAIIATSVVYLIKLIWPHNYIDLMIVPYALAFAIIYLGLDVLQSDKSHLIYLRSARSH